MAEILVVDDEQDLLDLVQYNLEVSGHKVLRAETGREGLTLAQTKRPDLVLLDVLLPDLIGFEVLRQLRAMEKTRDIPVILLTARGEESDVLVGFELGADDYVVKPFSPRELLARVRAILQRAKRTEDKPQLLEFEDLSIDFDSQQVFLGGEEIILPPQEFRLLAFLASHPRRVYSREALLAHAWGADVVIDLRTVDVHIRRLRSRLEPDAEKPRYIETVRGTGYRFNPVAKKG